MGDNKSNLSRLAPVMLAFFTMGFVDMVGTATNYVKADFALSDTMANFLPSMVFLWFFFLSIPIGLMMNKIGKRKTVLLSLVVTALAFILPLFSYSYPVLLLSFCLLGIGNTLMQVSLNPLASLIAPLIASWASVKFNNWMLLYPIFLVFAIIAAIYLGMTKIEEEIPKDRSSSFIDCLRLLGDTTVLLFFLGIISHVGIDVGVNTCAPKIIMERLGLPLEKAGIATSIYFLFRTLGCFSGSFILARFPLSKFFAVSVFCMVLSMIGLFVCHTLAGLYVSIALVGFGNSNIFSMIFSRALLYMPEKNNELSGLLIMGLIGGTIFPLLMGVLSDALGSQVGSVLVINLGVIYLIYLAYMLKKGKA